MRATSSWFVCPPPGVRSVGHMFSRALGSMGTQMQESQNHELHRPVPPTKNGMGLSWAMSPYVAPAASASVFPEWAIVAPVLRTYCSSLGPGSLSAGQEGPWWKHRGVQGPGHSGAPALIANDPHQLQDYGAATIMHEEVIRAEAKQAGAERYLASFPLVGHTGPLPPRCARQSSRRSDQSQSRRGARETVLGRSLGKINTLQDLCQAAPPISTPGLREPRRGGLQGWQALWAGGQSGPRAAATGVLAFCGHCPPFCPVARPGPTPPSSGCLPPTPRVPKGSRASLGRGGHTEQVDTAKFREAGKPAGATRKHHGA